MVGLHDPIPAKVILCEGEKAADAAQAIFLDYACISWPGGVNSIKHADLTPLQNRDVIIWPVNDGPGRKATIELRRILPNARVLRVDDLGDGDDAADVHPDNSESWFADRILPHELPPDTNTDDNHNADGEWPRHFFSNKRGMWFEPPSTEKNPDPDPIWICAPFTAVAETADEAGNSWGLLLQWRDPNALDHQWAMPRRLLHADGNQIAMELEGAGLKVGTGKIVHELLKELLGRLTRLERKRCVMRCGWHQTVGGHPFLLPSGETFGKDGNSVVLQTNHVASADAIRQRGSLQEWQEHVGRYAIGNYRLALSISTSLTGPLLDIVGEPSGGLHLHGGSQIGKTTLLRSSASVSGRSNMGGPIRTWRATANGLESVAAETCDATLYLDEISMANAKEVGEIVYALPSEIGKVRAARDGSARSLLQTWRVMFLSTGEIPLAAKMQEHGITPMAGQEVRLISIPADAGVGLGVYQNLHGMSDGAALSQHLSEASRTYYGTAARAFLERLANDRGEDAGALMTRIRTMRDAFVKSILPPNADGQVISVAGRFALIAAAGELARSFGVLPWPDGESERAAAACFRAWLDARGGFGADEDMKAVAAVRRFIEQHGESRFTDLGSQGSLLSSKGVDGQHARRDTINRAGFRRKVEGTWEFWVFPEQWRTEVCKGLDSQRAAAAVP